MAENKRWKLEWSLMTGIDRYICEDCIFVKFEKM